MLKRLAPAGRADPAVGPAPDTAAPDGLQAGPPAFDIDAPIERRGRLRVRTLLALRWLSVVGQTVTVLATAFWLKFELPLAACLTVIAASAWLNVGYGFLARGRRTAGDWEAAGQLCFDVVQTTVLLALTGGLQNPFCLLLVAPATVAAATLPTRQALAVAVLAGIGATALAFWRLPLPWAPDAPLVLPRLFETGMWLATVIGIAFTAGYAWQAASESTRMELALTATQRVLSREQRLSALGALAAAAAHELGTPLATIQVVAKELLRSVPPEDPVADDARLLISQAQRCRDILQTLARKPEQGDIVYARLGLAQLLQEIAEPYRMIGPTIVTKVEGPPAEFVPDVNRLPEMVHALASFVENACDFALSEVRLTAHFDDDCIAVTVKDDGPGFAPDILVKLGEPYVTSRPGGEGSRSHHEGMGLGFFIAKTLLERSGADVRFGNERRGGAVIEVKWPRDAIEADAV